MSSPSAVTPGRHTRLILDLVNPVALRPPWSVSRRAEQITRSHTAVAVTKDVQLQPGNAWTLRPFNEDLSRLIVHPGGSGGLGGAFNTVDVNLGPHWEGVDTWRAPTDLPGIDPSGSVLSSGSPAFYKRVPAGADWDSQIPGDAAALPPPPQESADIPMDRMLSSKGTYPTDCGFVVAFRVPPGFNQADTMLTLYFGGPNEVTPVGRHGGEFCVTVRGSGKAILRERNAAGDWVDRHEFSAFAGLQGNLAAVMLRVFPYGRDTIALSGGSMDGTMVVLPFSYPVFTAAARPQRFTSFYRNTPVISGYRTVKAMTGVGPVRLDVRRDVRTFIQLVRLRPPVSGTLTDLPFWIPFPIPADTHLTLTADAFRPQDTAIAVQLYAANTDVALTSVGLGVFKSLAGQQAYYAKFTLTADPAQEQTPVLYRYRVDIPAATANLAPVSITGGNIRSVSVTGPDLDPTQDTAHLVIQDPTNALALLRARGRIPARIGIYDDSATLISILHEGEVSRPAGTLRGKTGRTYPNPNWFEYDLSMVGIWARLAEAISLSLERFDTDETAAPLDTGFKPPWKVTSIIRYLLLKVGFPASQIDIPDIPIRLFMDGRSLEDFLLQPTVGIAEFIKSLCDKYLAMTLIWDGNAGAVGMWRLLFNPTPASTILADFIGKPTVAGRLATHPNSYAVGQTFVIEKTYREEVRAPEGNFVLVIGAEQTLPSQIASSIFNPISFDFTGATSDPTHIDYLGRIVPIVQVDPTLVTRQATSFVARRIFNFACHGQKWLKFQSPLLLVTDPGDPFQSRPRPLRVNDAITVFGQPAIVRSVAIQYTHDATQKCEIEAVAI